MFHVVLYRPEIPPNTGNIIRLCANTGCALHLIGPLGFTLDERRLRRAGLDYREYADIARHATLEEFRAAHPEARLLAFSTRGQVRFDRVEYRAGDALLFGGESCGLPPEVLDRIPGPRRVFVPMRPGNRSLNLSNAVAVCCYQAWRRLDFAGA